MGDVTQLVERWIGTPLTQVRFLRYGKGFFSQSQLYSADSLMCVRTLPCAVAWINICAHVKDPVVHVRFLWIMETLKHPTCTARGIPRGKGKATRMSHWKNKCDNTVVERKKKGGGTRW